MTNSEFLKLNKKFDRTALELGGKIDQNAKSISKLESRFDELIGYLSGHFEKIDLRLSSLENTQDFILGEIQEIRLENSVGAHRSRRMEDWIIKAAKKINVPYKP